MQRYAVWGLGRSGIAASNLLAQRGKTVVATDPGMSARPVGLAKEVDFAPGPNTASGCDCIIASPGLKPSLSVFARNEVPVFSEIELGWAAMPDVPYIGITGTDGKTTTTELTTHLLRAGGLNAVAAGNIGTPLCEIANTGPDIVVAEVSAFQLWSTHEFAIEAGAFTNIAPDHLDYFQTWDEYLAAKHRMVANSPSATVAFNRDDNVVRGWGQQFDGTAVWFGAADGVGWAYAEDSEEITVDGEARYDARAFADAGFFGVHNIKNFMAAAAIARARGVPHDVIREAMASFSVGAHRIEHCADVGEVAFYDDSKATNAHAAMAGINAVVSQRGGAGPLVVIAGGVDKQLPLADLARLLASTTSHLVLIGEIRERLAAEARAAGCRSIELVETMAQAVQHAYDKARPTGTVLLSPACSSFDMFDSYAHRGDVFVSASRALSAE